MINRNDVEIKNQIHEMYAEGCQHTKPIFSEITDLLKNEGFSHDKIESHYDEMQGLWRWLCDIKN